MREIGDLIERDGEREGLILERNQKLMIMKNYRERKQLACFKCKIELRSAEKDTGIGYGRVGRSEYFADGLYKLFYLSSMKEDFREAVRRMQQRGEVNRRPARRDIYQPLIERPSVGEEFLF